MGPTLAPIWNDGRNSHEFSEDEKPENMAESPTWREVGTDPGANNGDDNKESCARHQRGIRGDSALDEIAGEHAGKKGVRAKNKDDRKQVASNHDSDRFQHGSLQLRFGQCHDMKEIVKQSHSYKQVKPINKANQPRLHRGDEQSRDSEMLREN
jgi:hypothetical protein